MTEKPSWSVASDYVLANITAGIRTSIALPVTNPPVEVTAAYPPNDVPVEIYEFASYTNVNTTTPHTNRFGGNAKTFADVNDFWVKSNGLPTYTPVPIEYSPYTAKPIDYVFKIPRQRNITDVTKHIRASEFIGVAIDGVPFAAPGSGKTHIFNGRIYTENDTLNPTNYPSTDGSGLVGKNGAFYYNSDPKLLYTKNPSQHSPIIGYAFDGWPIYGPYGFANSDGTGAITLMTSSYQISSTLRSNDTLPDGTFIEDYEYVAESGTLDQFNGRECITPEYPNGVYAYFITVNSYNTNEPMYPYILGPHYKSRPLKPNGNWVYPDNMEVSVISYKLPPGLLIMGNNIIGTPYSLKTDSTFRFVLRAENSAGIADKTLVINVTAQTGLLWETLPGALPVGNNNLFPEPMQFNPNYLGPDMRISGNGLIVTAEPSMPGGGAEPTVLTTYAIKEGMKVMFSMIASIVVDTPELTAIGIATHAMDLTTWLGSTNDSIGYWDNGKIYGNSEDIYSSGLAEYDDGAIIDVAVDRQNHLIWFRVDGGPWNNDPAQSPVSAIGGFDISFIQDDVYPAACPYFITGGYAGQFTIKKLPSYEIPYGYTYVGSDIHGDTYYVLDNAPVKYQLSVVDQNLALSQDLNFYIPPNGGELPAGVTLDSKGLLSGFTKPVFTTITTKINGNYDMNFYDSGPYDYGVPPNNGFDSFFYDTFDYDYSYLVNIPKKLNRYYQFIVRATDGYFFEDRKFKIYLVGDDHLRADTTLMKAGTNFYRADVTYLRKPIWLTPNYLGVKRANNYITIFTSVYTSDSIVGVITYLLDRVNDDETPSRLPLGLTLDDQTGTIYGEVPYQPAISKAYKFTIRAYRLDPTKGEMVSTARTFTMDIIGDVEGTITFITPGDLGTIDADMISTLMLSATTKIKRTTLIYSVIAGRLPPGLILFNDGSIQGKVNQFENDMQPGLTTIDMSETTFDGGTTSIDRQFVFTVRAADQLGLSATTKTFSLVVNTPNMLPYSNIYVKPFLSADMRVSMLTFFNNVNVFTPTLLYRATDRNFGVQTSMKMLLYPGIETVEVGKYVSAFGRSSKKKFKLGEVKKATAKLPGTNEVIYEVVYIEVFDDLEGTNGSIAKNINIQNRNYPVKVNQGRRDPIDSIFGSNITTVSGQNVHARVLLQDRVMGADYGGQRVNDFNRSSIFGNSVTNIRDNISQLGDTQRNYLPLWMRTAQSYSGVVQSFTKAIPICYTVPGGADKILLNIKHSGFDFKDINYTIDRAIIDSVADYIGDKYLMFPAREVING